VNRLVVAVEPWMTELESRPADLDECGTRHFLRIAVQKWPLGRVVGNSRPNNLRCLALNRPLLFG